MKTFEVDNLTVLTPEGMNAPLGLSVDEALAMARQEGRPILLDLWPMPPIVVDPTEDRSAVMGRFDQISRLRRTGRNADAVAEAFAPLRVVPVQADIPSPKVKAPG